MSTASRIAVICAMESEAVHLRRRLVDTQEHPLSRWRQTRGRLGSAQVDLIVSGIGLINAAAATSALCVLDPPQAIFNYGCSGAHREDIDPGDVVLAENVVHFSSQIVLPDGAQRYLGFRYEVDGRLVLADRLPADPGLLARARDVAARVDLPLWPGVDHLPQIHTGTVASADVWTQHGASIRTLHDLHGSLCEEMEAAAVAQVSAIHGIPFLAVKDVSNNELRDLTDLDVPAGYILAHVEEEVGKRAAMIVEAVLCDER